jgi:hypothetical protein
MPHFFKNQNKSDALQLSAVESKSGMKVDKWFFKKPAKEVMYEKLISMEKQGAEFLPDDQGRKPVQPPMDSSV